MSTFALDISKACQKFGIEAHVAARKIILDIQHDTVMATPVLNGFLRSNFFVGIGTPPTKSSPALNDNGASSEAEAQGLLASWKWGTTVYMTNNLPYAYFIEFGGSKVKAPAGMLRISVARQQAKMGRWS